MMEEIKTASPSMKLVMIVKTSIGAMIGIALIIWIPYIMVPLYALGTIIGSWLYKKWYEETE
jgi:hypothetical protein